LDLPNGSRLRACFEPNCINLDNETIKRVLQIVIENAVQHNEHPIRIAIVGRQIDDFWHLTVRDNGAGIPTEKLESAFQPMTQFTLKATKSCGMGLPILRRISAAHSGSAIALPAKRIRHGATIAVSFSTTKA
jgi:K+-sensing histidine kinase KdpD